MATVLYGTPRVSAIMKAAAPITGGRICPPTEAVDSTAPANVLVYPTFLIKGMVNAQVDTTLAMAETLIEPINPDAKVANFAGRPPDCRAIVSAKTSNTAQHLDYY